MNEKEVKSLLALPIGYWMLKADDLQSYLYRVYIKKEDKTRDEILEEFLKNYDNPLELYIKFRAPMKIDDINEHLFKLSDPRTVWMNVGLKNLPKEKVSSEEFGIHVFNEDSEYDATFLTLVSHSALFENTNPLYLSLAELIVDVSENCNWYKYEKYQDKLLARQIYATKIRAEFLKLISKPRKLTELEINQEILEEVEKLIKRFLERKKGKLPRALNVREGLDYIQLHMIAFLRVLRNEKNELCIDEEKLLDNAMKIIQTKLWFGFGGFWILKQYLEPNEKGLSVKKDIKKEKWFKLIV